MISMGVMTRIYWDSEAFTPKEICKMDEIWAEET